MNDNTIRVSDEERQRGRLDAPRLVRAIEAVRNEGYVVLEGGLARGLTDALCATYDRALAAKVARFGITPVFMHPRIEENDGVGIDFRPEGGNHDLNRWNMHLPSRAPFFDDRVLANPFAMDVVDEVLGAGVILPIAASDTPLPRAGYQNVHQDDVLPRITINVPLVDVSDDNAPLEVWPRSHLGGSAWSEALRLTDAEIGRRVQVLPSRRLLVPRGSMIIRDQRMLHRGTANRTEAPRPMLSLLYFQPPADAPPRALLDQVAKLALELRERARQSSRLDRELLDRANALGRHVEYLGGSDRDYRRPIPGALWASLSHRARRLLRLATVDGLDVEADDVPRTKNAGEHLLRIVQRHMDRSDVERTALGANDGSRTGAATRAGSPEPSIGDTP